MPPHRTWHHDLVAVAVSLTIAEAVTVLSPPVGEQQLRQIIRALGWKPSGHRHTGRDGRPAATFEASQIMRLHAALVPFLAK